MRRLAVAAARRAAEHLGPATEHAALQSRHRAFIKLPVLSVDKTFVKRKTVPYSPQQIFDVVADVDQYHKFVPFCVGSTVTRRLSATELEAELAIGFQLFTETYTSQVTLQPARCISVRSRESRIFDSLTSTWRFADGPRPGSCVVDFAVALRVSSPLHAHALELFFAEVAERQICAFEARCQQVYVRPPNKPIS